VKIATFNINNINKRLENLLAWLAKAAPDVIACRSSKPSSKHFPQMLFAPSAM